MADLDDLKLFLEERLLAADPSIDLSVGSPFQAQVIGPTLARLGPDPFESPLLDFIRGRLKAELPNLVVQEGEVLDDTIIKPARVILEPFRRQIRAIGLAQSTDDPTLLNEREADARAANFFVDRNVGGFAIGVLRLSFSVPQYVLVSPANVASTSGGLRFVPAENQAISADAMLLNTAGELYFFDIAVRAEFQGTEYNVGPNEIRIIDGMPNVVRVTNPGEFEDGLTKEDNTTFLTRVERSLAERSLVTSRGVLARTAELLENLQTVTVIGHNDPEMLRDLITGSPQSPYAFGHLTAIQATSRIVNVGLGPPSAQITDGAGGNDFTDVGTKVGDILLHMDPNNPSTPFAEYTVTRVVNFQVVEVTPAPPDITTPEPFSFTSRDRGSIFLSNIPGGILRPTTPWGDISVENNQVHIGGMMDVYTRAGLPGVKTTTLPTVKDGVPKHLALDLVTYGAGAAASDYAWIDDQITGAYFAEAGDVALDEFLVTLVDGAGAIRWQPDQEDVGRFVEIRSTAGGVYHGLHAITLVHPNESDSGTIRARVQINDLDLYTNTNKTLLTSAAATCSIRVADQIDRRYLVTSALGTNFAGINVAIGDSLIIETGADAGIYTVRRILDLAGTGDTLMLDRPLTSAATALRYRVTDALDVDVVAPKVLKIPISPTFPGGDLNTVAGSTTVTAAGATNFQLAGVVVNDVLVIKEGTDDKLEFTIDTVAGTSLVLAQPVPSTATNLDFEIHTALTPLDRPLVRVQNVEVLDADSQPTGNMVPYGEAIDVRTIGPLSNRSRGSLFESFTGQTTISTVTFTDTNADFTAEGVIAGDRLEIFEGLDQSEFEIAVVGTTTLTLVAAALGGTEFLANATALHYRVGQPSIGQARVYFLNETTARLSTGLRGTGRLLHTGATGDTRRFRFSEHEGSRIYPADPDTESRDLRMVRSYQTTPPDFESILELTDTNDPDAFDLELEVGDVVEVHEEIPREDTASATSFSLGIFGTLAGLRTVTGSAVVTVPENSITDFGNMGPANDLVGQRLYIDSGPDQGQYTVEEVVDRVTLRLNTVMTATTSQIKSRDNDYPGGSNRDASLTNPVGSEVWVNDPTNPGGLGGVGEYITLFECFNTGMQGTFKILTRDVPGGRVQIDAFPTPATAATLGPAGSFTWAVTDSASINGTIEQLFRCYNEIPTDVAIVDVGSEGADFSGSRGVGVTTGGAVTSTVRFEDVGAFGNVIPGDILEILDGPNIGRYFISVAAANNVDTFAFTPFPSIVSGIKYRVWPGVHGARRWITVGPFEGSTGLISLGTDMPFRIRRPRLLTTSSTAMQSNTESGLFYLDAAIESLGPGDDRNLGQNERLVVEGGVDVDGYTYRVDNNALTFSSNEELELVFSRRFLPPGGTNIPGNYLEIQGRNLQVTYESSTVARIVHDLITSGQERVVTTNPLGRHMLPSYVHMEIQYSGGSSADLIGEELEDFINNLGQLDTLDISQVERVLTQRGATRIIHPVWLVSVTHDIDRKLIVERSQDRIGGLVVPYNGTARISSFFTRYGEELNLVRT